MNKTKFSKLLELKEWLTLPEAAKRLSGVCNENVTEADILRLALNRRLKLSVFFIGKTYLRPYIGLSLDNNNRLNFEDKIIVTKGLWNLLMVADGQSDIENRYQKLTGGPQVGTSPSGLGVIVTNAAGKKFQLQEKISNKWLLSEDDLDCKDFSFKKELPYGCLLVVRTEAIREFEQLISEKEPESNVTTQIDIKPQTRAAQSNGYEERHAKNREQILGAAFSVMAIWPNECRNEKGDPVASKIARMIEAKAGMFWPDAEPPLKTNTVEELVRDWLKKTASRK